MEWSFWLQEVVRLLDPTKWPAGCSSQTSTLTLERLLPAGDGVAAVGSILGDKSLPLPSRAAAAGCLKLYMARRPSTGQAGSGRFWQGLGLICSQQCAVHLLRVPALLAACWLGLGLSNMHVLSRLYRSGQAEFHLTCSFGKDLWLCTVVCQLQTPVVFLAVAIQQDVVCAWWLCATLLTQRQGCAPSTAEPVAMHNDTSTPASHAHHLTSTLCLVSGRDGWLPSLAHRSGGATHKIRCARAFGAPEPQHARQS